MTARKGGPSKGRPVAGVLSAGPYHELREAFTGDERHFQTFLRDLMTVVEQYRLGDPGSSAEQIERFALEADLARDLGRALKNDPFFRELFMEKWPRNPAESDQLDAECEKFLKNLDRVERWARAASNHGRRRSRTRSTRKDPRRAQLWEPITALWKEHGQQLDYRQHGVVSVIRAIDRALGFNEASIHSIRATIAASRESSP
jgi:hypothetical protein